MTKPRTDDAPATDAPEPTHINNAVAAAAGGERVAVVAETHAQAVQLLRDWRDALPDGAEVRLAAGLEQVRFPNGGLIRFLGGAANPRGHSYDMVAVVADTAFTSVAIASSFLRCLAKSPRGRFERVTEAPSSPADPTL